MAIEVNLVVNGDEHQVDLNNNQRNGDKNSSQIKNSESDDLILKLKRIILEQEMNEAKQREQLNNDTENKSADLVNGQLNKSSKTEKKSIFQIIKSPVPAKKMINQTNNPQINYQLNGETNGQLNKTKDVNDQPNHQTNQQDLAKNQFNNGQSNKIDCQLEQNKNQPIKINGQLKSTSDQSDQINGKLDQIEDQPLIKETIKKINEKALDKVNQIDLTTIQNSNVKILVNGNVNVVTKECLINQSDKTELNKIEEIIDESTDKKQESSKTTESKIDKLTKQDEIKIIQSKAIPNNKTNKIDLNNNVQQTLKQQNAIQNGHQPQAGTDTVDKQIKSVEINGGLPIQKELPEYELIIRASDIDGKRKGADLFCQEYFMDLYLLAELQYIDLKILTIDIKKPSQNYRSKFGCTKPPILLFKVNGEQMAILENEKIERFIMKNIPGGNLLFHKDPESAKLIENLYCKFKLALSRNEPVTKQSLLKHLEAIDKHLGKRKSKFLTGNHVCCFDFELISKLQHIRVAGSYFIDDFEIPESLNYLWKYMDTMYHLNAFKEASPDDQTIISHYLNSNAILKNRTSPAKTKNQTHLELQKPCITISTP